jgi:hypothetical protein
MQPQRCPGFGFLRFTSALLFSLLGITPLAQALTFNVTFDASTNGAPAGFLAAFNSAIQFHETSLTDPITINLQVGWVKINGQDLITNALGQSATNSPGFFTYYQVRSPLINDAKSAADMTAIANVSAVDPYGGTELFTMSNAEAKALGLLAANTSTLDGWVGFSSATAWTFDPNNRAVVGKFDIIGIASHEITEVMGRYGLGQNGASSGRYRRSMISAIPLPPSSISRRPVVPISQSTAAPRSSIHSMTRAVVI